MENSITIKKKKWQKGLSLIEASMVLVLSAVVVAGVMVYYQSAQENNKMEKTLSQMLALVSGVNGLYANQTNFNGIDTQTIAQSGAVPASAIVGQGATTAIVNGFATNTEARPSLATGLKATGTATNYALLVTDLDMAACTKVATQRLGGSHIGTMVGTKAHLQAGDSDLHFTPLASITPAVMAGLCSTNGMTVGFVLK